MSHPKPALAPIISAAMSITKATDVPKRTPVITTGRAPGSRILNSRIHRLHDIERATLTRAGSTLWRPDNVPKSNGQKHVHHRMQTFANSPMPNRRTNRGNNENALTCPKRRNNGPKNRLKMWKYAAYQEPQGHGSDHRKPESHEGPRQADQHVNGKRAADEQATAIREYDSQRGEELAVDPMQSRRSLPECKAC